MVSLRYLLSFGSLALAPQSQALPFLSSCDFLHGFRRLLQCFLGFWARILDLRLAVVGARVASDPNLQRSVPNEYRYEESDQIRPSADRLRSHADGLRDLRTRALPGGDHQPGGRRPGAALEFRPPRHEP